MMNKQLDQHKVRENLKQVFHELRTPLNMVLMYSELLSKITDESQRKDIQPILDYNKHQFYFQLDNLSELLDIEQEVDLLFQQEIDLNALIKGLYEEFLILRRDTILFTFRTPVNTLMLRGDMGYVKRILNNLLDNAFKFTKQGTIEMGYYVRDNQVEIYVKDTGSGISPENHVNIFRPFFKENSFTYGLGLGLTLSREIAKKIGAHISVRCDAPQGTYISIRIPLSQ